MNALLKFYTNYDCITTTQQYHLQPTLESKLKQLETKLSSSYFHNPKHIGNQLFYQLLCTRKICANSFIRKYSSKPNSWQEVNAICAKATFKTPLILLSYQLVYVYILYIQHAPKFKEQIQIYNAEVAFASCRAFHEKETFSIE